MSWKSTSDRFGSVAIAVHWITAGAIIALFALGIVAANARDNDLEVALLRAHVPLGLLVLVLTLGRIGWWVLFDRRPNPPFGLPIWQAISERVVRTLLYVVLILMGASGIALMVLSGAGHILFFGGPGPLPNFWNYVPMVGHFAGAIILLGLAGLHIAAALYHQFFKRDHLLARMGIGSN